MGDVVTETPLPVGVIPIVEQLTNSSSEAVIIEPSNPIITPNQEDDLSNPTAELVKPKPAETEEALTDISADDEFPENDSGGSMAKEQQAATASTTTTAKKSKSGYKYDPEKITLRFLFANRDGLTVNVECKPSDTVGEVKGALLSMWPEDFAKKASELGGDNLRLICMGKGFLMPDTRTLEECQVPVFKTHPTPINVSIKPQNTDGSGDNNAKNTKKSKLGDNSTPAAATGGGTGSVTAPGTGAGAVTDVARQGCCVIQ